MRVTYEWWEEIGTCAAHRYAEAEGETREEVDAEIRRHVGTAEVMIVGLHNIRADFEAYTGVNYPTERYPRGFADSPPPTPGGLTPMTHPAPKGRFRRGLDNLRAFRQA